MIILQGIMLSSLLCGLLKSETGAFLEHASYKRFITSFLYHISAPRRFIAFYCKEEISATENTFDQYYLGLHFQVAFLDVNRGIPENMLTFDRVVFHVNLQCKNSTGILNTAKQNNMYRKSNVWLFAGNISKIGNSQFFSKFTDTFFLDVIGTNLFVYKIFKITSFSKYFSMELVCNWSFIYEVAVYHDNGLSRQLKNLRKEPIRVSYALIFNESIQHLSDYRFPRQDQASKIVYLLINQICLIFNATHVPTFRSFWGVYENDTKSFTPLTMFSDIQLGLADIAGNTAGTTHDRLRLLRFLAPTGNLNLNRLNRLKWFFKAPPLSYTQNIWILPFVKQLWIVAFLLLSICYIAIATVAAYELNCFETRINNERNCWFIAYDIIVTTLTLRGSSITFSTYSAKLICYSLFFLVALLNTAYTAHLLVLLQSTAQNIQDFNDILNTGMDLGNLNETYYHQFFLKPNDWVEESHRQKIYSYIAKRKDRFWMNASEGMKMVKNGMFAYHAQSTIGYEEIAKTYDEATKRSIRTINSVVRLNNYLCTSKNSTLDDFLTFGFLHLQETGIVRREQKRLYPTEPLPDFTKAIFTSLHINHFAFIFLILLFGLILSVFILVLEITVFNC